MVVRVTVINSLNTTPVFVSTSWELGGDAPGPTFKDMNNILLNYHACSFLPELCLVDL